MSLSVPGLGVRKKRMRTDKVDFVTVCAWSGGEEEESGNRLGLLCHCLCLVGG